MTQWLPDYLSSVVSNRLSSIVAFPVCVLQLLQAKGSEIQETSKLRWQSRLRFIYNFFNIADCFEMINVFDFLSMSSL
jgi:hypothetical protein